MRDTVVRMAVLSGTVLVGFAAAALLGKLIVPVLRRLHLGQTIREEGPKWHREKQGTPTMGGVIFIAGCFIALLAALIVCETALPYHPLSGVTSAERARLISGICFAVACGLIGFADDYIKVVRHRNLGLTPGQKIVLQVIAAGGYASAMFLIGDGAGITLPFVGKVNLGLWYLPLCIFFAVGFPNAANLTDGVDGLCGSVTAVASLCLMTAATVGGHFGQGLFAAALAGGIAGFLLWNLHPAKVFMGDTGSLFLGGAVCAVAFGIGRPALLLAVGVVYVVETLSVILQVTYFKITKGKRLFKMSPLHHHFELCGWSENVIVLVFSAVTALCGGMALAFFR